MSNHRWIGLAALYWAAGAVTCGGARLRAVAAPPAERNVRGSRGPAARPADSRWLGRGRRGPRDEVIVRVNAAEVRVRADASGHWRAMLPAMPAEAIFLMCSAACSHSVGREPVDIRPARGRCMAVLRPVEHAIAGVGHAQFRARDRRIGQRSHPRFDRRALDQSGPALAFSGSGCLGAGRAGHDSRLLGGLLLLRARSCKRPCRCRWSLIHSSWGGSGIETWIGESGLRAQGGFDERLDLLRLYAHDPEAGSQGLARMWEGWWRARAPAGSEPWKAQPGTSADWRAVPGPHAGLEERGECPNSRITTAWFGFGAPSPSHPNRRHWGLRCHWAPSMKSTKPG